MIIFNENDLKVPFISKALIEYLETAFGIDVLLESAARNNDEHVGYMRGVRDILRHLKAINEDKEA